MSGETGEGAPVEVVRARRIELVDAQGTVRAVVGDLEEPDVGGEGTFGFGVLDAASRLRVWLALGPSGPVLVFDQDGNVALELGISDPADDLRHPGAHFFLASAEGEPRIGWRIEGTSVRRIG